MKNIEEIYNDGEVVVSIFDLGLITVTMFPGHECLRLYEKHSNHIYDQKDIKEFPVLRDSTLLNLVHGLRLSRR